MNSACLLHKNRPREEAMNHIVDALMRLPRDKTWKVVWAEAKSERSSKQNAYLNGVAYKVLGDSLGYERDETSELCCGQYWGWKQVKCPKTPNNPRGVKDVPIRTTTRDEEGNRSVLGRIAFGEYVSFIQRWAAQEFGVVIPDPDPDFALKRERRKAA